jgi:hypothetical protein
MKQSGAIKKTVAIVVPFLNEEENLPELFCEDKGI